MPIVLTASTGTALSTARSTWATVGMPGERLSETSSALGPFLPQTG